MNFEGHNLIHNQFVHISSPPEENNLRKIFVLSTSCYKISYALKLLIKMK